MKIKKIKEVKSLIERTFKELSVQTIKKIGSGHDSVAFLVNNETIFKIKFSENKKKGYEKEKAIYDFLNSKMKTNIQIPNIEFSYITDELSILGYKQIKGEFLSLKKYSQMTYDEQESLKIDIAKFLKEIHSFDCSEIVAYTIDNKANVLEEYELLQQTIYNELKDFEKKYIEDFMSRLRSTDIFDGKKCLCHNDFSCNHLLIDEHNKFVGVIDFGDAGIIDEYCDFVYLLEDSEEEIGVKFGEDVLKFYGDINVQKAKEYQDIVEQYYPIETIVYGIKNNRKDFIKRGRKEISLRVKKG